MNANSVHQQRLRALLGLQQNGYAGLQWQETQETVTKPVRERVLQTALADGPHNERQLMSELQECIGALLHEGLHKAIGQFKRWAKQCHLAYYDLDECCFEVVFDVPARSATRKRRLDAVLYVDGIALAVVAMNDDVSRAQEQLESLEESVSAWFVTPCLLVAMGADGVVLSTPGAAGDRWLPIEPHDVASVLRPTALVEYLLFDDHPFETKDGWQRAVCSPQCIDAVRGAVHRAKEPRDALLSIEEGAGHRTAIQSVVARLIAAGRRPIVLSAKQPVLDELTVLLASFKPSPISVRTVREITASSPKPLLGRLASLACLFDDDRLGRLRQTHDVVVAVDVDFGFRGALGFSVRQLLPDAPWLSFTTLPPDAVPSGVKHAFASPLDEGGFVAFVEATQGRVPVAMHTLQMFPSGMAKHELIAHLGSALDEQRERRVLVLVPTVEDAKRLCDSLKPHFEQNGDDSWRIHDATRWGTANDGWALLREDDGPRTAVIRCSLPAFASPPALDAAFVYRSCGDVTLARLRTLLGRPANGKESARLLRVPVHPDGDPFKIHWD